jgi:hypothetical protein
MSRRRSDDERKWEMRRLKLVALTTALAAVLTVPGAAPATAAESHPCDIWTDPISTVCMIPYRVYCMLFPPPPFCH